MWKYICVADVTRLRALLTVLDIADHVRMLI